MSQGHGLLYRKRGYIRSHEPGMSASSVWYRSPSSLLNQMRGAMTIFSACSLSQAAHQEKVLLAMMWWRQFRISSRSNMSAFFFISGGAFCYFVVFPNAFAFFVSYATDSIVAMPKISDYLSFVLKLILAFGLVFEMPLFAFFLARMGIITAEMGASAGSTGGGIKVARLLLLFKHGPLPPSGKKWLFF